MKKVLIILVFLSLLLSCGKKEMQDEEFSEFTEKIDRDIQELFERKEVAADTSLQEELKEELKPVAMIEEPEVREPVAAPAKEPVRKAEPVTETAVVERSGLTTAQLWQAYGTARKDLEKAQDENDFEKILSCLQQTSGYAKELKRNDIAAWQLNNIGYYSIEEFKRRINYDTRMNRLNQMPAGDEKRKYYLETKEKVTQEFPILRYALPYLKEARTIDRVLDDEKRTRIIQNNIQFIEFVSQAYIDE